MIRIFFTFAFLLLSLQSCKKVEASEIEMISPEEMQERLETENIQVIDVRSAEDFSHGHILTAKNVIINQKADNLQFLDTLNKSNPVVIYGKKPNKTKKAIQILEKKGFKQVYELEGGIENWILLGGKLNK